MGVSPLTRTDFADVPLQVGLWQATFNSTAGYAAFDFFSVEGPQVAPAGQQAFNPTPGNKATDVRRDVVLGWSPAETTVTRDVYFGTSYDDVNAASRDNPGSVLASRNQDANTFDPAGLLTYGQSYYWRIDEVNAAPDSTIFRGAIWNFTAEPYGYPVKPVKATASSSTSSSTGPEKTIDGSGLTNGMHSTSSTQMWLSKKGVTPVWIQYEFDGPYMLYQMLVWNSNQVVEPDIGYGAKDVTIETSVDGTTWTALAGVPEFAQATGEAEYTANTTVDFQGTRAKYVKLTIKSNWSDWTTSKSSGLSEVQFSYVPVVAREPKPANGAAGVGLDTALTWRPGRLAARHEVYFGADKDAVTANTALAKVATEARCPLTDLAVEYGQTYYWKVSEVNDAATPKSWDGPVWSFSTPDSFVVDDFEKYDNTCNRIFFAWVDGFGYSAVPACGLAGSNGNGSGSTVGNFNPPFAERTNVHGGSQAMPFSYDNTAGKTFSEAERTLAVAQDWTQGGLKTLVLFFRGSSANTTGQLYVKINGVRVDYKGSADALARPLWKQWNIDLSTVGTSMKSVKTLAVGVSASGKGSLIIDDIRLYRTAPEAVQPTDPGTNGLSAYYAMEGDVKDSSGKGNNGTVQGSPSYADGPAGYGKAIQLNGVADYVELPIGNLISTLASATFSIKVNMAASTDAWQRIFDFGTGEQVNMFLTPNAGVAGLVRFAITTASSGGESGLNASAALTGWHHVAVTIDGAAKTMQLYIDGELAASGATTTLPSALGKTTQNWLGRSQYATDAYLNGALDEFRIYNRSLSAAEVRYLAGDR